LRSPLAVLERGATIYRTRFPRAPGAIPAEKAGAALDEGHFVSLYTVRALRYMACGWWGNTLSG